MRWGWLHWEFVCANGFVYSIGAVLVEGFRNGEYSDSHGHQYVPFGTSHVFETVHSSNSTLLPACILQLNGLISDSNTPPIVLQLYGHYLLLNFILHNQIILSTELPHCRHRELTRVFVLVLDVEWGPIHNITIVGVLDEDIA